MNLEGALESLCRPRRRAQYPRSLMPMQALLAALGAPQQHLPAIVVAGSSGKSSLCLRLAQEIQARGLRVGCYLSPHLHSLRERMRLDGCMIGRAEFIAGAERVAAAAARLPHEASTFERATALALDWYRLRRAQFLVLEVGLGGRFDAVNAVENRLALLTPVEAEHMAILGGTLERVAWHKAGVIGAQGHALGAPQGASVRAVLEAEATQKGARLDFPPASLAQAALENLQARGLIPAAGAAQPAPTVLPGRMEWLSLPAWPRLLIDGGHTPLAARYLRAQIERHIAPRDEVTLMAGFLADKDAGAWLRVFDTPRYRILLTRVPGHRGADPDDILRRCALRRTRAVVEPRLEAALEEARASGATLLVIAGSLKLAAQVRVQLGLLPEAEQEEARLTEALFSGVGYLRRL